MEKTLIILKVLSNKYVTQAHHNIEIKTNENNCSKMLCDEGILSIKCFLGTAALVFTLTSSQNVLGFTPHHIWGASLWGPMFYFVIICISLRLFLSYEKYQVIDFPNQKVFLLNFGVFVPVCYSSHIFGFYIFVQYSTVCASPITMEGLWCIWNDNVNFSLFRISGYSLVKSKFFVHELIHFKSFTTLCLSCDIQLD